MLPEISLNVLDIAENSIRAQADLIQITLSEDRASHLLTLTITDNGSGMTEEQIAQVIDPFFTSRTTRKVGLGIPFLKQAAEITGGSLSIASAPGKGTSVKAQFHTDSIDCMPLGDMEDTIFTLVIMNESIHFVYTYVLDDQTYCFDTREIRAELGDDLSFQIPEISAFIKEYLNELKAERSA